MRMTGTWERTAWLAVILLIPVALLNYLDRQMLAAMKLSMVTDLPDIATKARWGLALAAFKWTYALFSPVGGYLADRTSRRHVICVSLGVWSACTWATGQARDFEELVWARAIMGVSEAFYMPAALALIADHHLGPTRSRAVGLHQMGVYLGVLAGGFAGYAADTPAVGWRNAFAWCGLIGIAYSVPLFLWLRNGPKAAAAEKTALGAGTAGLLRNRDFLLLVAYFTLPAMAAWVVRDWMPDILRERFGLGQGKAGVSAVVYWQVAAIGGAVLGGWLADRWTLTQIRGRIFISAIGTALLLPALFGVGNATDLAGAVLCLVLFGLGWGFFDVNSMPILCQLVGPEHRATGYGLMNLVSISCGGFADWIFGALRDQQMPLNGILGVFAGIALLSIFGALRIRPQDSPDC